MVSRRQFIFGSVPTAAIAAVTRPWTRLPGFQPAPEPNEVTSSARCWMRFDLRTLHMAIPDVVGECVENEHVNPDNGDTLQRTTGGLLVWRRSDRLTAFTDGARTWANGPNGVEVRRNSERFEWEPTPPPAGGVPAGAIPAGTPGATPASGGAPAPAATPRTVVVTTPQSGAPQAAAAATARPAAPTAQPGDAVKEIFDAAIVGSLKQSGLPLAGVQALTADTDPEKLLGKAGQYSSKIAFRDTRSAKGDGAVEIFQDAAAMKGRADKLEALAKTNPALAKWVYQNAASKMLVAVPKDLTPEQAKTYQSWLANHR